MATNFVLTSSSSSSSLSSSSSDTDEDLLFPNRKIDLSFHDLDDENLEHNLSIFQEEKEDDEEETEVQETDDEANQVGAKLEGRLERVSSRVEKLLLYNNRLKECPISVTHFVNLSVLDLSNNLVKWIPEGLGSMKNLTQLFLRNNLLGDDDLPKTLQSITTLRDLNLSGNRFTVIPPQVLQITSLRNLFMGGNRIEEVPAGIKNLKRLRVLYLGGNLLKSLPAQICQLQYLHALILCDNRLETLPDCVASLKRLQCLQLHRNHLTTIPYDLVHLKSLSEISLRDNPLVVRFVHDMSFQPSSLLELAARKVTVAQIPFTREDLPASLYNYLGSSRSCVNPNCKGVYFNTRVEHVKFVDFCGKYKVPLMQYLCSSTCSGDRPAVTRARAETVKTVEDKMKRVLLG